MHECFSPPIVVVMLVAGGSWFGCKQPPSPSQAAPTASLATPAMSVREAAAAASIYDLMVTSLDGTPTPLATYRGKVALLVNTASECGFTPQYEGLETLYQGYRDRDFVVLGFPSNDFGEQEPGTSEDIRKFCSTRYHVTFPMFAKLVTKGEGVSPLYAQLTQSQGPPKWNFHKYVVNRQGVPVAVFPSAVTPDAPALRATIDRTLAMR